MSSPFVAALDGALGSYSIAVAHGGETTVRTLEATRALEDGLALLDQTLAERKLALGDADALAVCVGPGGFTGLRIVISYAKALAFAHGLPLVGVSSYDVVEASAGLLDRGGPTLALLRPRAGVYAARLRAADVEERVAGDLATVAAFVQERSPHFGGARIVTAAWPPEAGTEIIAAGVETSLAEPDNETPAAVVLRIAADRLRRGAPLEAVHAVRADYGEAPAVTLAAAS